MREIVITQGFPKIHLLGKKWRLSLGITLETFK